MFTVWLFYFSLQAFISHLVVNVQGFPNLNFISCASLDGNVVLLSAFVPLVWAPSQSVSHIYFDNLAVPCRTTGRSPGFRKPGFFVIK